MCCSTHYHDQPQTSTRLVNRRWGEDGWCVCRGDNNGQCCGNATAADGLCDRCRKHCKPDTNGHPEPAAEGEPGRELVAA